MTLPAYLTFASDAEIAALWGAGLLALALVARIVDGRQVKRARIDRVGLVPWTGLFLGCAVAGVALLALAIQGLIAG